MFVEWAHEQSAKGAGMEAVHGLHNMDFPSLMLNTSYSIPLHPTHSLSIHPWTSSHPWEKGLPLQIGKVEATERLVLERQMLPTLHGAQRLIPLPAKSLQWYFIMIWDWFSTCFTFYIEDKNSSLSRRGAFLWKQLFAELSFLKFTWLDAVNIWKIQQVAEYKYFCLHEPWRCSKYPLSFLKPMLLPCICVSWNAFINLENFRLGNTTLEVI